MNGVTDVKVRRTLFDVLHEIFESCKMVVIIMHAFHFQLITILIVRMMRLTRILFTSAAREDRQKCRPYVSD